MKNYIVGIKRFSEYESGYKLSFTTGRDLGCPKTGLISILENLLADQQSRCFVLQSHNVLSESDIRKLYESPHLSKNSPTSFQTHLIFDIALSTGIRLSKLHQRTCSQFRSEEQEGEHVIVIRSSLAPSMGASENSKGGWRFVLKKIQKMLQLFVVKT